MKTTLTWRYAATPPGNNHHTKHMGIIVGWRLWAWNGQAHRRADGLLREVLLGALERGLKAGGAGYTGRQHLMAHTTPSR
jgi:hypothetical protein